MRVFAFIVAMVGGLLTSVAQANVLQEQVLVPVTGAPASSFRQRLSTTAVQDAFAVTLTGTLYRPAGAGTFPALVLMHDCRGVRAYQRDWAEELAANGYVTLLLDGFSARSLDATCDAVFVPPTSNLLNERVYDAFAAKQVLTGLPYVDADRIGVLGWDYYATLGTVFRYGTQQLFEDDFAVAVSFYPQCRLTSSGLFVAPVMVLVGAGDDWTPARECVHMQTQAGDGRDLEVVVLEDAVHGFDDTALQSEEFVADVHNVYSTTGKGATFGYNAQAAAQAKRRLVAFLQEKL